MKLDKKKNISKASTYQAANFLRGPFSIQVGAFGQRHNAERLAKGLIPAYNHAQVKSFYCRRSRRTLYRVLVGKCSSLKQAQKYESSLKSKGFTSAFTVAME